MMIYENDKLNIPEKYKRMSVSELQKEKERIYMEIRQKPNKQAKQTNRKKEIAMFHF